MHEEERRENGKNDKGRENQQARARPLWTIPYTAIAFWVFVFGFAALLLFVPDYISNPSDASKVIIESTFSLAIVIVIVVHAIMYYKQANEANKQANAMERSLVIGEQQRDFMHLQASTMRHQLDEMIGQKRAMENTLNVMKAQAKTMDKSLVFGSRAYLGGKPRFDLDDAKCHLFIDIENFGRVPAKDIQVIIELEIASPYKFVPQLRPSPRPNKMFGKWFRYEAPDPDSHIIRIPFLFSHGRTKLFPTPDVLPIMIRLEENAYIIPFISLIKAGHSRVLIRGRIQYSDGFHKDKLTEFAFRYYLKNDIWIPQTITQVGPYGEPEEPASDYQPSESEGNSN
jgi:uncharacterized membrane protein YidH (DUF202 family)